MGEPWDAARAGCCPLSLCSRSAGDLGELTASKFELAVGGDSSCEDAQAGCLAVEPHGRQRHFGCGVQPIATQHYCGWATSTGAPLLFACAWSSCLRSHVNPPFCPFVLQQHVFHISPWANARVHTSVCLRLLCEYLDEALVITHESAPPCTWEPYLQHRLRPLRPIVCWGRDRSSQPSCAGKHAVWWWWKDL